MTTPTYGTPPAAPADVDTLSAPPVAAAEVARELSPAEIVAGLVGKVVQDDAGRFGLVVGTGRPPNLAYLDPDTRQPRPEAWEPLVIWLPPAAPFGHPLTVVG